MMDKYITDALYPFSMIEKQLLLTIRDRATEYGATLDDIVTAIEIEIELLKAAVTPASPPRDIKATVKKQKHKTLCPLCGSVVDISRVNISKCTHVGGSWKSSLMCRNKNCRFTELSEKSLHELGA